MREAYLVRHPQSAGGAALDVRARWVREGGTLSIRYVVEGDVQRVRVPKIGPPRFADDLWKHTCFELFLKVGGASAYREFNFSPSREWAAYAFSDYRKRAALETEGLDPDIEVDHSAARLQLDAAIPLDRLAGERVSMGVCAVIEEIDGTLSYWALRHPAGKPDFHHADGFAAVLE